MHLVTNPPDKSHGTIHNIISYYYIVYNRAPCDALLWLNSRTEPTVDLALHESMTSHNHLSPVDVLTDPHLEDGEEQHHFYHWVRKDSVSCSSVGLPNDQGHPHYHWYRCLVDH